MRGLRFANAMKSPSSAPQDCAGLAPQLTALFDGEANELMASQARAHLLSCPACSRQWLDWTRYRDTLQSEPAPAPPPTLLWRVLISYRVAALARPARRRSNLPQISTIPLREIEAPLPPRLTQHILSRTTRRPSAHVMLTPLGGPAPVAKSRFKGRSFAFRHAPLWAAPALALWILMLGRADFNATLPLATPDSAVVIEKPNSNLAATNDANPFVGAQSIAPIPVADFASFAIENTPRSMPIMDAVAAREASQQLTRAEVATRSNDRASEIAASPIVAVPVARPLAARNNGRSGATMNNFFLMALNAGRRDMANVRTTPRPEIAAPVAQIPISAPKSEPIMGPQPSIPEVHAAKAAPRVSRRARFVAQEAATTRVTLAALASPVSPIRIVSAARVRAAAFSEDVMRPRVAHLSADGRRLARARPDDGDISLRVSRPSAGAPMLRETSFNNGDNGPKLDELRSAVDDFRASVAGAE